MNTFKKHSLHLAVLCGLGAFGVAGASEAIPTSNGAKVHITPYTYQYVTVQRKMQYFTLFLPYDVAQQARPTRNNLIWAIYRDPWQMQKPKARMYEARYRVRSVKWRDMNVGPSA